MQAFQLNLGPKLIQICDAKAKESRMNAENKLIDNNIRHYGEKVIMKDGKAASLPVKNY